MAKYLKKKIIPDSFNDEIKKAIKAITYNKKNIIFAGSFVRKSFRDASDIDICENFGEDDKETARGLQHIIKNILKHPEYIILDIKSGIKPVFVNAFLHLGHIKNKKIINFNHSETLRDIHAHKHHIDITTYNDLIRLCKPNIKLNDYFDITELIRKLITLRWTPAEVIKGYKISDGVHITLEASMPLFVTKIDMAFIYSGFYTEISNIFSNQSAIKYGRTFAPITPDPTKYDYCIKYNLLEYIVFKKPLKALKRCWTLAITDNDNKTLETLYPIISSNVAILNRASSIIKTHSTIIEKYGNKYNIEIKKQLDNLKPYISHVYEFDFNEKHIDDLLDNSVSIKLLSQLSDDLDDIVSTETEKLIKYYKFKIPSRYIL